ncbi:MAG: ATP-binding protein [Prevotella sp.]|nr:ATP-binding protein [Candidatus Prevotella equi]
MKINNPFLIYGYVSKEYFCDREEETRSIVSALRNARNQTLMSPRRMGKTGLIHNVFSSIEEKDSEARCFYLDIYSTKSFADFVKLFGETVIGKLDSITQKTVGTLAGVLSHCKVTYSNDVLLGSGKVTLWFEKEDAPVTLGQIFAYLGQSDKECYIAIDEFQQILEYPEDNVESLLRTYVQQYPMLHFIFSGSKNHMMSAMFDSPKRPFYRSTEKVHLGVILEEPYYDFAVKHLSKTMTVLPREIFHYIYQQFGGHTWYVQYVLNKLYELSPAVVDMDDIMHCLRSIVERNNEDYQRLFRLLTSNQQQLLSAIAKEGRVSAINSSLFINKYSLKGSSSVNKALKYLLDNEFVYLYEDGYEVYDRFMALWLNK